MEPILIGLIVVIIVLLITMLTIYSFKYKNQPKDPFQEELALKITDSYLSKEEINFLNFMNNNMDKSWKIVPKVGVDKILQPTLNKNQYNLLMSNYLDFVIFDAKYKPLFIIDLVKHKYNKDDALAKYDKNVTYALGAVKLPIVIISVADFYIWDEVDAIIQDTIDVKIDVKNQLELNTKSQPKGDSNE